MKKLVTTPLTNTIWWATVNEAKGTMNTSTRIDVTDNAISAVLDHLRGQKTFEETGFAGYKYDKKNGGTYTIAAYDERHITVSKEVFDELREYKKMIEFESNNAKVNGIVEHEAQKVTFHINDLEQKICESMGIPSKYFK